ncbi:MAG: redoxin family protein [Dysgonamonadaceae bacterium]|jgi:thiol-disulfide isomerase/thioredoxin|nr:redoxin family protein [Dysgonamonadaceae bacterium]
MKYFFEYILIFSYVIIALACSHSTEPTGKATLSGKFSGHFPVGQIFSVKITVPNSILGTSKQVDEYETHLEPDGSFSLSIPLFHSVYALFSVNDNDYGAFFLSPDKATKIDLSLNEKSEIQIKIIKGQGLTPEDMDKINRQFMEFIQKVYDPNSLCGLHFNMSPDQYKKYILEWTEKQLLTVKDNDDLPESLKQLQYRQLKWYTFINYLFGYEDMVRYLYENQSAVKNENDTVFVPVKPDKSYYSFIRFFDMNNPPLFNAPAYPGIFRQILDNNVLNIPRIDSWPITDWLKKVKATMADLTGSDTGLFYDMLALHAYWKQLDEELKPFSDQQKEDIKIYFKNPTFVKFLFTANEETVKQAKLSGIIKETPAINKDKLMEAIVSSHKGNVVVVDFWATWCGPCLDAIKKMKGMKEELRDKKVVFIYITDPSSPAELWKKKISGIDGKHYYLTEEEKEYLSVHFQIDVIPTYLIYDSTGTLKHKLDGFPGTAEMQKMIEELLP